MTEVLPPIKTVAEILESLNAEGKGSWVALDDLQSITIPKIEPGAISFFGVNRGIILKVFLNLNTAEIRMYVAKFLNIPGRENLF